ncbi:MAG: hypothetical protein JO023_27315 [Chloroflexi bacterium]|nr:hypothetical protein [Chloroflexota bacterium]
MGAGRSAVDAAVAAVRCVEDNRDDHGVGASGIPSVLGQVELDASVNGRPHPRRRRAGLHRSR